MRLAEYGRFLRHHACEFAMVYRLWIGPSCGVSGIRALMTLCALVMVSIQSLASFTATCGHIHHAISLSITDAIRASVLLHCNNGWRSVWFRGAQDTPLFGDGASSLLVVDLLDCPELCLPANVKHTLNPVSNGVRPTAADVPRPG